MSCNISDYFNNQYNSKEVAHGLSETQIAAVLNKDLKVDDLVFFSKGGQQDYSIYIGKVLEIESKSYGTTITMKTLGTGRKTTRGLSQVTKIDETQLEHFKEEHPEYFV